MALDARHLVRLVRRFWWLVLLGGLVGGGAGYGAAAVQQPLYSATATLLVGSAQDDGGLSLDAAEGSARLASTFRQLVTARSVLQPVISAVDLSDSVDQLRSKVTARTVAGVPLLDVTVTDPDPQRAAVVANAVADSLAQRHREQAAASAELTRSALTERADEIQRQIGESQRRIRELEERPDAASVDVQAEVAAAATTLERLHVSLASLDGTANALEATTAIAGAQVSVWSPAAAPTSPVRPRTPLLVLLGALAGLMVTGGAIAARAFFDASVTPLP